jgi:glyoxylase-like metal-dependent hydrolase (beta-lactamase superfamily II)
MISAGKGDSYIISDSFGTGTTWTRMLVDGGVAGTGPNILAAYNNLPVALGEIKKLDVALCTHYDDDHVAGMILLHCLIPSHRNYRLLTLAIPRAGGIYQR